MERILLKLKLAMHDKRLRQNKPLIQRALAVRALCAKTAALDDSAECTGLACNVYTDCGGIRREDR